MPNTPWPHPESLLGIEYHKYFARAYIPILLRGEQEWLNNATTTYASDAGEVWASDILTRLQENRLQHIDVEDLQLYTPNLLKELLPKQIHPLTYITLQETLNAIPFKK